MKKIILPILFLTFFMLFGMQANANTISSANAVGNATSVTVSGEIETGATAVMIKILSGDDTLAMRSYPVLGDDTFTAVVDGLTLTAGSTYTVNVADFDGGVWFTTNVTIPNTLPNPPAPPVQNETTQNQSTQNQATSRESAWITGILKCTYSGSQSQYRAQITMQGPECRKAFTQVTPAGFAEAFSFNLIVNNQVSYDTKTGKYVLFIPKEFQKAGRVFKMITIDEQGKPSILDDEDTSDETITIDNLNYAGYAFSLIYSDSDKQNTTCSYVVQRGDTLSKIAKKLGKTMDYIILQNGILNPNKIFKNQIIKY